MTKENVVLIWYLLCSKRIYLFDKKENIHKFDTFLRRQLGTALGVNFGRIWDRFWEIVGTLKAPKYGKKGVRKTVEKQDLTNMRKKVMQAENGAAGRGHVLP